MRFEYFCFDAVVLNGACDPSRVNLIFTLALTSDRNIENCFIILKVIYYSKDVVFLLLARDFISENKR